TSDCGVSCAREPALGFVHSLQWEARREGRHHVVSCIGALIIDDENLPAQSLRNSQAAKTLQGFSQQRGTIPGANGYRQQHELFLTSSKLREKENQQYGGERQCERIVAQCGGPMGSHCGTGSIHVSFTSNLRGPCAHPRSYRQATDDRVCRGLASAHLTRPAEDLSVDTSSRNPFAD